MSDAEVMTTAIVAALFFGGNLEASRRFLQAHGYMPRIWKALNADSIYVIDTFPIPVCDNIRIARAKIYRGEVYRGYQASKRRYFYGLKIHLMVTQDGHPVEFFLTPGSYSDTAGLEDFGFALPEGAWVLGDKAYNHYEIEDVLAEAGILLLPVRKKNSKRPLPLGCASCSRTTARPSRGPAACSNGSCPNRSMRLHRKALSSKSCCSSWQSASRACSQHR